MTMASQTFLFFALFFLGTVFCNVKAQSCGGSYVYYYSNNGVLLSPNYPGAYNTNCQSYYVISLSTISTILLTFETFELDRSSSTGDYLTIRCSSNSSYIQKVYYWNSVAAPISIPWCRTAQLFFRSDSYNTYPVRGFRIQYQVGTAGCGNTVYMEASGNITSPNYPQAYNSNENCTYSIWTSQPSSFTLTFESFSLELCDIRTCSCDWIQIWCDDTGYTLLKYCGSTVPWPVSINNCNQVLVWFRTDVSAVSSGFSLQFSVVPNGCGQSNFAGLSGTITSPNYPRGFLNINCSYNLYPLSSVTLKFLSFDLEPFSDNSNGDYVQIDCISESNYGSPIRGKTIPQPVTFPSCGLVRVFLCANTVSSGAGFNIQYMINPSTVYGTITTRPMNAAAYVGTQLQLNCTSNITSNLPSWTLSKDGTAENIIASFCVVNSDYTSQYSVESGGPGVCNLLIRNATLAMAGVYTCIDASLASFSAILSIIEVLPNVDQQREEVCRGDVLRFQYFVKFASSVAPAPTQPMLIAWNSTRETVISSITNQSNVVMSSYSVTAEPEIVPSYEFTVSFSSPPNRTDYATNAPTFTFRRYTTLYNVLYWPEASNMIIKGDNNGIINYNEVLQCNVSSNPPSSYRWLDHINDNYIDGSIIAVTHDGMYTCNASNVIRNRIYSSSKSITISVGKTHAHIDVALIVLTSLLGICVLGYIVLILYHVIQRFRIKPNSPQGGGHHSTPNAYSEQPRSANPRPNAPNFVNQPVYDNVSNPDPRSGPSRRTPVNDADTYECLDHASHEDAVYDCLAT